MNECGCVLTKFVYKTSSPPNVAVGSSLMIPTHLSKRKKKEDCFGAFYGDSGQEVFYNYAQELIYSKDNLTLIGRILDNREKADLYSALALNINADPRISHPTL